MRKIQFVNGEYYHIYNRGVDKRNVFIDENDFWKFFDGMRDFNNTSYYEERLNVLGISNHSMRELKSDDFRQLASFLQKKEKVVDLVGYNLIRNHFHLILKQLKDKGISNFMHKLGTSFTNFFNKKYERSGALFQGVYKAIHIDSNDYLLQLAGYVNGNIEVHNLGKAKDYAWSSYQAIRKELSSFHDGDGKERSSLSALSGLDVILSQFKNQDDFCSFVQQIIKEGRKRKEIKKYLLE